MFEVTEIDGNSRCQQSHTQSEDIFHRHNDRERQESGKVKACSRNQYHGKNDDEAQEHIDETACHIGNGYHHAWEVYLLDEVFLRHHGSRTDGDGG